MVPLVGFDDDLYKKSIPIGATVNIIDLRNGTLIAQLNKTILIHGGANSLLSIEQSHEFGLDVHDVDKSHGRKQYIHVGKRFIPMIFDKALMYVPIWEATQWDLEKLTVLCSPQTTRGIQIPSIMNQKLV